MTSVGVFMLLFVLPALGYSLILWDWSNFIKNWSRLVWMLLIPCVMVVRSLKSGSLSNSGRLAALMVGFIFCGASWTLAGTMIGVYLSCSKLTKLNAKLRNRAHQTEGNRNWVQVLSNAAIPCLLCSIAIGKFGFGGLDSGAKENLVYSSRILACLSCLAGDTWASEVGSVLGGTPRLITTLKKVPSGTNGGVTICGLGMSLFGGLFTGFIYRLAILMNTGNGLTESWLVIVFCGLMGLIGSVIDSILGAFLQISVWDPKGKWIIEDKSVDIEDNGDFVCGRDVLSNSSVNLLSIIFCAFSAPYISDLLF